MSCQKRDGLVDAYFDGELDVVGTLEFEDHLKSCAECRAICHEYEALRHSLHQNGVSFEAPAGLEQKIRALLPGDAGAPKREPRKPILAGWRPFALAASLAILVASVSVDLVRRSSSREALTQQVVSSHIRSLMANHFADVPSSDQHTVKPWFNGKLDYAPVVKDLAPEGFPLVGGRLDYLDGRPVAALLYKRRQHPINLFVWPASDSDAAPRTSTERGYNVIHWVQSGMTYWAVSDLNANELNTFVRNLQK